MKTPPTRHTITNHSSHGAPPANTASATARRAGPAKALRAAALTGQPSRHTFNGLTAAVAAQMPVQPPMAIQTALPPLGGVPQQPVPLKRPAPESTQKKKRVRRHWDECTNCDSKHGMRYGRVVNRQIQYLGCDRCKGDYFATHGVKLKDLTRVCECGSGKDRRYGPKGGTAVACVECKDQKVSQDGQPLDKPETVDGPMFLRLRQS